MRERVFSSFIALLPADLYRLQNKCKLPRCRSRHLWRTQWKSSVKREPGGG